MPCRCDYMEPTAREAESVRVRDFLRELGNDVEQTGSYGKVETLDEDTATLCALCQTVDVTEYSLELQMWWRNHQEADRKRLKAEAQLLEDEVVRAKALAKLTDYEKKLLGIKDSDYE